MNVKIYSEYNLQDFKDFVNEFVGHSYISFIEENNLWQAIFNYYKSSYGRFARLHHQDEIINELNDLVFLNDFVEEEKEKENA